MTDTTKNPLRIAEQHGQSIWSDFIRRSMIESGQLARLIDEDGVSGVTSNPSIFEKAIAGSHDYDQEIRSLALAGKSTPEIVRALTVEDIQRAADLFRPTFERTGGADGFVSLEVSPDLVHDTEGTVVEARRLWAALDRPNVMIKVPATTEGLPAIRQLIADGVNVNVTLLFGLRRYRAVTEAHLAGLEDRVARGEPLGRLASVASFFLSRIDVLLDPRLAATEGGEELQGQVAIACAKVAYQMWKELVASERFRALAAKGAQPQRLLWASTSTKNPSYRDVMYVEPLIGPDTINTMPLETIHAFRDHGDPTPRLEQGLDQARAVLAQLAAIGVDLEEAAAQLEAEGAEKFKKPWAKLGVTLEEQRKAAFGEQLDRQALALGELEGRVADQVRRLGVENVADRLWRKDASLWPDAKGARPLGWLNVAEKMEANLGELTAFADEVKAAGFRRVVLCGMGGSSLAPLAFARTLGRQDGGLPLVVLDTTDPTAVLDVARVGELERTLFIVASKSGTTAEPVALEAYFHALLTTTMGARANGNFVAITDPGTPLAVRARDRGYRRVFLNFPDIGGRYSALSNFGLVPAALLGLDVGELLERALRMAHACAPCVPEADDPALVLGAALGELSRAGRDKVTFLLPPLAALGWWLEQLLAESTGKVGRGILPVVDEPLGKPAAYGEDRVFVRLRLFGQEDGGIEPWLAELGRSHPIVTVELDDLLDMGQELFRWELATAVAGMVLGLDPFDQPNVQEAKDTTNRLLALVRRGEALPEPPMAIAEGPLAVAARAGLRDTTVRGALRSFLGQARPGDYAAILAYLPESPATDRAIAALRRRLRDRLRIATTAGYGPRYLHSTGQYHKGGPPRGLFLELTVDDAEDVAIPGEPFTFGTLRRAQALGDLEALERHGSRALRVHLGPDAGRGLALLEDALDEALP